MWWNYYAAYFSRERARVSGVRVVTSNTKETTIATAATFIDTNGSDSGGGIHRSAISGMSTRLHFRCCWHNMLRDEEVSKCLVVIILLSSLYAEGEEVIPRVRTTHITVHNNNKDVTDNNKKKLLLSTDPSTELLIIEARSDSTNRPWARVIILADIWMMNYSTFVTLSLSRFQRQASVK